MRARFLLILLVLLPVAVPLRAQQPLHVLEQPKLRFTENRGQIVDTRGEPRPDILFIAPGGGSRLYLRNNGLSYVFTRLDRERSPAATVDQSSRINPLRRSQFSEELLLYRMDVEFVGANLLPRVTREEQGEDYSNYYLPHCPDGVVGVRNFGRVVYHDLYSKIDLVLRATDSGVKSEFVLHPGADPSLIRVRYRGSDGVEVLESGALHISSAPGEVEESAPYSFLDGEVGRTVASRYVVKDGEVGFALGSYDRSRTLTIDPLTRTWATCVGGSISDYGIGITTSRDGGIYLGGYALSTDFPVTVGVFQTSRGGGSLYDLVVARFTPLGARRWATYIGGSGDESGGFDRMVAAGPNGDVAITGSSNSADFPTSSGAYQRSNSGTAATVEPNEDAVLAVFDNNGMRRWATYLGGNRDANYARVYNGDKGQAVTYDRAGNILLTGHAFSQDFPVSAGAFQNSNPSGLYGSAFITRFTSTGILSWSTFFGGNAGSVGYDIITGDSDRVYIAGRAGTGLPTTLGAYQTTGTATGCAFVATFDSSGQRRWATYFGPTYAAHGVVVDALGAVTIAGEVSSASMPTTIGAYRTAYSGGSYDGFITKLSSNGTRLLRSTYIGSAGEDHVYGLTIDRMGGICVSGSTTGSSFPVSAGAYQMIYGGGSSDAFLMQFDSAGRLFYSSYYGGGNGISSGQDVSTDIAFDSSGALYMAGYTESLNFPTTAGAFQTGTAGARDAFIVKFDCVAPTPTVDSSGMICSGDTASRIYLAAAAGYRSYRWSTGDTVRAIAVKAVGSYSVTVIDSMGCISSPKAIVVRERPRPEASITTNTLLICPGDSAVLQASPIGPYGYRWNTGSLSQRIVVRDTGTYTLTVTDTAGCFAVARTSISFYRPVRPSIFPDTVWLCAGDSTMLTASDSGYAAWQWSNGLSGRQVVVRDTGRYTVTTLDTNGCLQTSLAAVVRRRSSPAARILPIGPTKVCAGDSVMLNALPGGAASYRWNTGAVTPIIVVKSSGLYKVVVVDSYGCRDSATISVTVAPVVRPKLIADGMIPVGGHVTLCEGDSLLLSTLTPYPDVFWSDGTTGSARIIKSPGRYSAKVRDANGCAGLSDTVEVTVAPRPTPDLSGPVAVCAGSRMTYSVTPQPGVEYIWATGNGMIVNGQRSPSITVQWSGAGSEWVRVEATNLMTGCYAVDSIGVAVGSVLAPLVRTSRPTTLCPGDSIVLDAGEGYTSYLWSNGMQSRTITVRNPGAYTVRVQDVGGCSGISDTVRVRLNTPPVPLILSTNGGTICQGDSTVLKVGERYASYRWSTGETTPTIIVRSEGNYSVEVADSVGCTGVAVPFAVSVNVAPQLAIDGPNAACVGAEERYTVDNAVAEPVVWQVEGGTVTSGGNTRSITVRWGAAGNGAVKATAQTGMCSSTATYAVAIANDLHPHLIGAGLTSICTGDSLELAAPSGYARYLWNTGETGSRITVRRGGEYWVSVDANGGCGGVSDTAIVVEQARPVPTITGSGFALCPGDSTALDAGPGYAAYRWSSGETTQRITVRVAGRYSVAVQNGAGGCWGTSDSVEVTLNTPMVPEISEVGNELEASAALAYQWSVDGRVIAGATAQRHRPTVDGAYTVTTVDVGGCSAASTPYPFLLPVPGVPHRVLLDTIEGNVGERLTMNVRVIPPVEISEGITRYRVRIAYDPRALYLLRATSGVVGLPDPTLLPLDSQTVEIISMPGGTISGAVLARIEMLGLLTGQPVNVVRLDTAELENEPATTNGGIVILHGCDVGRTGDFERAVAILGVRWREGRVEVHYRAPVGAVPQLVVYDMLGRAVGTKTLDPGTGEEQVADVGEGKLPSGIYRIELRDRAERDATGVAVQR